MHKEKEENGTIHMHHLHPSQDNSYRTREIGIFENGLLDADVFLQVSNFLEQVFVKFHFNFVKNKYFYK